MQLPKVMEHKQISGFYSRSTAAAMDINQAADEAARRAAMAAARRLWQECKCPPAGLPDLPAGERFRVLEGGITLLASAGPAWPQNNATDAATCSSVGGGAQSGSGAFPGAREPQPTVVASSRPREASVSLAWLVEQVGLPADHALALFSALAQGTAHEASVEITTPALEAAARVAKLRIGDRLRLLQAVREVGRVTA